MITSLPDPGDVTAFLRSRDWVIRDRDDRAVRWEKALETDAVPEEAVVPLGVELADYRLRLSEALSNIALAERVSVSELLETFRHSNSDLVEARLPTTETGSMPLSAVGEAVPAFRDLLLAAASSAASPQANFPRRKPTEAVDFLDDVRFLAPRPGSFVLRAASAVPSGAGDQLIPDEPFPRRATVMLASGLLAARDAARSVMVQDDWEAFDRSVSDGVSANLCGAIAEIGEAIDDERVDLSLAWSPLRPVSIDRIRGPLFRVVFTPSELTQVREAARSMRRANEVPDIQLEGIVTTLDRDQAATQGEITLKAWYEDRTRPIRMRLEPDDYSLAVHAHEARATVSVEVDIQTRSGHLRGLRPRHFAVIDETDDVRAASEQPGFYE